MASNGIIENTKKWPQATRDYYHELRNEMKRVTWPSRTQVQGTTAVVIITVFLFGAFFFVVDGFLNRTVTQFYHVFTR
jgi:preprotein translocase subunit SecE